MKLNVADGVSLHDPNDPASRITGNDDQPPQQGVEIGLEIHGSVTLKVIALYSAKI